MKKLLTIITLSLIALLIYSNPPNQPNQPPTQTTKQASTTQLSSAEEYTYTITAINSEGYHGTSTTDQTGIFFTHDKLSKGTVLTVNDNIKVTFPKGDWETITKVVKIN